MTRKPTRRGIRRRATRHRSGGTVYQNDARLDRAVDRDRDQSWFWTPHWQDGERRASQEIAADDLSTHYSIDAFLDSIDTNER